MEATADHLDDKEYKPFLKATPFENDDEKEILKDNEDLDNFTGSTLENELKKDNKYYFISHECRSYLLIALVQKALADLKIEKNKMIHNKLIPDSKKSGVNFHLTSPLGTEYGYKWIELSESVDQIALKIIKHIKDFTIVDWARTTNQKACPLSLEKFDQPYILNLNGRTYSKSSIMKALETTLFKDEPLRLEDITIQPSKLEKMIFWPNHSFLTSETLTFSSDKIETKDFNETEGKAKTIHGFSQFIKTLAPTKNGLLDGTKLYHFYATQRSLPQTKECLDFCTASETIEDLVIRDIKFPKHHPKTGITFRNILFEDCVIDMKCWCGIKVKSSKMVNCTIDLRDTIQPPILKKTQLVDCTIIINNNKQEKGSWAIDEKGKNVLETIHNIVEDAADLEDCTLKVV